MRDVRGIAGLSLLAFVGAVAACAGAANPLRDPFPARAFPFATDTVRMQALGPGARRLYLYSSTGPWAMHALDIRLDQCHSAVAVKGGTSAVGRTTTSALLRDMMRTRQVVGGVNADFFLFAPAGVPTGAHVSDGRVLTPPGVRPVFAIDSTGAPHIVTLAVRGGGTFAVDDSALAHASLMPFHPLEAVGGRPILVRDSVVGDGVDTEGGPGFATGRHPRTAVGFADGGKRLLLVVVDGRQKPYSDGMTLRELAMLMLALGAREALNLDGGGSTALVFADPDSDRALRVANRPSVPTGERAVGNALAVVRGCAAR